MSRWFELTMPQMDYPIHNCDAINKITIPIHLHQRQIRFIATLAHIRAKSQTHLISRNWQHFARENQWKSFSRRKRLREGKNVKSDKEGRFSPRHMWCCWGEDEHEKLIFYDIDLCFCASKALFNFHSPHPVFSPEIFNFHAQINIRKQSNYN